MRLILRFLFWVGWRRTLPNATNSMPAISMDTKLLLERCIQVLVVLFFVPWNNPDCHTLADVQPLMLVNQINHVNIAHLSCICTFLMHLRSIHCYHWHVVNGFSFVLHVLSHYPNHPKQPKIPSNITMQFGAMHITTIKPAKATTGKKYINL